MASSRYARSRVRPHTRADGTFVRGHYRKRPQTATAATSSSRSLSGPDLAGLAFLIFIVLPILAALAQSAG